MKLRIATIAVVTVTALVVAMPAAAQAERRGGGQGGGERPPERQAPEADRGGRGNEGLSDSIRRIERSTRSQVLSAERIQSDGRDVNRIKTVDGGGRVRIYTDDPNARQPQRRTRGDDD